MARSLDGAELAGFIKERQAKQVRNLRQTHKVIPKLAIIMTPKANAVVGVYVRGKQAYAEDILIETILEVCEQADMSGVIERLNADESVQGIIVQLPLDDPAGTDEIVNVIMPEKDVDGLGANAVYPSATADAINWLCGGYGVELAGSKIVIVGQGRLVGKPLLHMWQAAGYNVTVVDIDTDNHDSMKDADVIVSAAGVPRLVTSTDVKHAATVIDAGTTSENGTVVGDVADDVRERADVSITPVKGGVGPLTIALLFDHLIQACLKKIS
jgi:methylenetetrahydrofolate dehydrogenase (NADP+)/methenyltetrahydrofolate cyclohydrolase